MLPGSGESDNYVQAALRLFEEFGDRQALVDSTRRLTFTELRQAVLDMTATLVDQGVEPGSAALVMVTNSVEGPILHLSLHLLGCRSMWIAPVTSRREMVEFTKLTKPDLFIYDTRSPSEVGREITAALPSVPVYRIGAGTDLSSPRPTGSATPSTATPSAATSTPQPEAFLQTSGTTGTPKLVHHKQGFYAQILALGQQYRAAGLPLLRHLSHSPMWLASGQMTTLFNLFTGGVLFLRDEWDPAAFLRIAEADRITSTFLTPPMLYEVLDHPDCERADLSSMVVFNVGAGPAAPSRLRQAIARFGPVIRIVYGLSEAVVITALPDLTEDPEHPERLRSCGRPYGDVRIEIRGTADGSGTDGAEDTAPAGPLPVGRTGEVWVHSRLSFSGYYGQPELTADTMVDGWVRTRDLGYLDSDGYLYLVDRVHDMIVTHRRNWAIFCRPIEDALAEHPQVRAAAVIGVPDGTVGEAPHAYVVPTEGAKVTEAELIALVTETLNDMWAPRSVEFVERLPRNRSAKVDKAALRAAWAQRRQSPNQLSSTASGQVG
ncbi:class I adenylate-forming enzyme family protein [Jatrophihabitans sp.]|jgi:acyl-CoA synthetase (AMP-forming)/AMP-acid ligase II|uniref:class I adenylate-forming enzyme family protein n=1 Tax=Jatrophihabitans sp. TaxID=1932789 RepID=UPI0038CD37F4